MNSSKSLPILNSKSYLKDSLYVDVCDLSVSYGDVQVLENVCLTISGPGKIYGIFGPNGGGKTTLLKSLLGLVQPVCGHVRLFGLPPVKARKFVGYIPQTSKFDFDFPIHVLDVVLMGRLSHAGLFYRYSKEDYKIAEDCLRKVGMWDLRKKQIGQLSGGQRQRVFIARALATQPKILLMDEPNTGLDVFMQEELYQLLKELKKDMAIILVSHDMGAIFQHVDVLACLRKTIHFHDSATLSKLDFLQKYGCPVDQAFVSLIAHSPTQKFHTHSSKCFLNSLSSGNRPESENSEEDETHV